MARFIFQSVARDGNAKVIPSANVTVYKADGTTKATIYAAETGSADADSIVTTGTDGSFQFWVDDSDYSLNQRFKFSISKTNFQTKSYDDIIIFPPVPQNTYYVDYNETDQGIAGSGYSVKDLVDSIGSTNATLVFRNNSGSATTSYTFSTSETIAATTNLVFEIGAQLSIDSGVTVTINGPLDAPLTQIFSGSGTVSFGLLTHTLYPNWWDSDVDNGTVVADTVIQKAVDAATAGSEIVILPARTYYNFTGIVTLNKALYFHGLQTSITDIRQATSNTAAINITSSDVEVSHLKLTGPQESTQQSSEWAISAHGADSSNYISNVKLHHLDITTWGFYGIRGLFLEKFKIYKNIIQDCYSAGIGLLSVLDGEVSCNLVDDIDGDDVVGTEVYGIFVSNNSGAVATYPISKRITVSQNIVKNCTTWEALDTHGGQQISFVNNQVYDCRHGIVVTRRADGTTDIGPKDCVVSGNTILNENVATADSGPGIFLVGNSSNFGDNNVVIGNTIKGHGDSNAAITASFTPAILVERVNNSRIVNNVIKDAGKVGISGNIIGDNVVIDGNTITDITGTSGAAFWLKAGGSPATGSVSYNTIDVNGQTAFYIEDDSINMDMIGNKIIDATTQYDQNGGTLALQYNNGRVLPVANGQATWDPASIAAGASSSTTISGIPGCSSESTAYVSVNRDLQGLVLSFKTGDTDKNTGTLTVYLYNNTSGAIDLASLTLNYIVNKHDVA